MSSYNKEANDINGLERNFTLKKNINFINSSDLLNNCLIIQYKFAIKDRVILMKR